MRRGLLCGVIILLCLITVNAFAVDYGSGGDSSDSGDPDISATLNLNVSNRSKASAIWAAALIQEPCEINTIILDNITEEERQLIKDAEEKEKKKSRYEAPVEIGSWKLHFGLSSSYDEYRYKSLRRLTGEDAYGRLWRTTARVHAIKERLVLSTSLSYEEFWGTGLLDRDDYSSLSLDFVPQYYLLRQNVDPIDLAVFLSIGGEHAWYDDSRLKDDQLDMWHYGGGFGAGRTFWFGDIWFSYLYQCHKNADGDDGVTDNGEYPMHRLGLTYTTLLTERIPIQASIYYNHSSRLPKEYDSDDFEGVLSTGWLGKNWSLMLGYRQLFDSSDLRNWGIDCTFSYYW